MLSAPTAVVKTQCQKERGTVEAACFPPNSTIKIWARNVPPTMTTNRKLRLKFSNTFASAGAHSKTEGSIRPPNAKRKEQYHAPLLTFLALNSLKSCIKTKTLKIIVFSVYMSSLGFLLTSTSGCSPNMAGPAYVKINRTVNWAEIAVQGHGVRLQEDGGQRGFSLERNPDTWTGGHVYLEYGLAQNIAQHDGGNQVIVTTVSVSRRSRTMSASTANRKKTFRGTPLQVQQPCF